jgi:splicing suppressor protein 51
VLYNPGVGHPRLRESWQPTLETVLASRKPVLITSFSLEDQQRDIAALQDLVASSAALNNFELRFRCRAKQNSFRSLKYQVDPSNVGTPIQTNSRVMVVQLAQRTEEQP